MISRSGISFKGRDGRARRCKWDQFGLYKQSHYLPIILLFTFGFSLGVFFFFFCPVVCQFINWSGHLKVFFSCKEQKRPGGFSSSGHFFESYFKREKVEGQEDKVKKASDADWQRPGRPLACRPAGDRRVISITAADSSGTTARSLRQTAWNAGCSRWSQTVQPGRPAKSPA